MYPIISLFMLAATIRALKATPIDHKLILHVLLHVVRNASAAAAASKSVRKDSSEPTD